MEAWREQEGETAMLLKIAAALILAAGVAQAAEPLVALRGESALSFQCRSASIPQARQCVARCDTRFAGEAQENSRFECGQACTTLGLQAIGECRRSGQAPMTALASR
jgi:hypothetical protein